MLTFLEVNSIDFCRYYMKKKWFYGQLNLDSNLELITMKPIYVPLFYHIAIYLYILLFIPEAFTWYFLYARQCSEG